MKVTKEHRKAIKQFIQICHEEKLGRAYLVKEVMKLLRTNSGMIAGDEINFALQEPDMHKYISLREY